MEPLKAYMTGKALIQFGHVDESFDNMPERYSEEFAHEVRNVCAKLHISHDDQINQVCAALNMKKRRFIELALLQAVEQAKAIINEFHDEEPK